MIAGHENGRAPEGAPTVTTQRASAAIAETEGNHVLPMGATPRDETDARPLSYDERRDWYTRGSYSANCAPDVPAIVGQPDHGYYIDSDDQRDITECGMPYSLPEDQPVPRVGDCPSCSAPRVGGCVCAAMALPQELVMERGRA